MNPNHMIGLIILFLAWLFPTAATGQQPWKVLGDTRATFPHGYVAVSPDGKFVLTSGTTDHTLVLDAADGKKIRELPGKGNRFAFSPDSKLIYVGIAPDKVCVWEFQSGKKAKELTGEPWALTGDGRFLVLAKDGLCVVETASWKELGRIPKVDTSVAALAVSPDGKLLAWEGLDCQIRIVDVEDRAEFRKIQGPQHWSATVHNRLYLAFAPDGKTLASATATRKTIVNNGVEQTIANDITVVLWEPESGKEIKRFDTLEQPAWGMAFTAKGEKLIVANGYSQWAVYGLADGKLIERNRSAQFRANDMMVSLHQHAAPRTTPFLKYLWDMASGKDVASGEIPDKLSCLTALPDGKTIVTGEQGGFLRFWDLDSGKEIRRIGETNPGWMSVHVVQYSPADKCVVSGHNSGDLQFWSVEDGEQQAVLRSSNAGIMLFAIARNGAVAARDSVYGDVRIWPSRNAKPNVVKTSLNSSPSALAFSEDGKILMAAGWYGLSVIDVPGTKVVALPIVGASIVGLLGPPRADGLLLAASALIARGPKVVRFVEPKKKFGPEVLSPDGKLAAGADSFDHVIRIWNLETGAEIGTFESGDKYGSGSMLQFSRDGRSLLVHNGRGTAVWEVESLQVRHTLPGGAMLSPRSGALSPNGRLAFGWSDRQILVWDLTGEQTGGKLKSVKHSPKAQDDLWADLQSRGDAAKAYRAMWKLAADPEGTVGLLKDKIAAIAPLDPARNKLDALPAPHEKILAGRIVELLEQIGTPAARQLLETLADSAKPQFTDIARQAMSRPKADGK